MKLDIPQELKHGPYCRTLGGADSQEMIGGGFMWKTKIGPDHLNHSNGFYSVSYLISGNGRYIDSWGVVHKLSSGSYFQRIPGYVHSSYVDEGETWLELFVNIGPQLAQALIQMGEINPRQPCGFIGASRPLAQALLDFRVEVEEASEDGLRFLVPQAVGLIQQLLCAGRQSASGEEQAMVNLACQLLSSGWQQRLDLEQMCRENGWGYERFRKVFRSLVGIPPAQYRIRRRIDEARRLLLAHPELSIKDIAEHLGYPSVYEFSAQFTRTVGQPPGRFRKG